MKLLILSVVLVSAASGQITIRDKQGSGAPPATCPVGQRYTRTSGITAGDNIYLCTALNTWTQLVHSSVTAVTLTAVSFSATPTFTRSTQIQEWVITLTGNVTSSTVSGGTAADIFIFNICQDGTGSRTFAWPTGFSQAVTISPTASICTKQTFYWSGSAAIALTPGITTDTTLVIGGTVSSAPATPASTFATIYVDSTSKNLSVIDDAGVVKHGVQTKAAVSNSFATAINDAGVVTVAQPTFSNLSGAATLGQLPASSKVRQCTVIIGDPGSASPVLADDNDSPVACVNEYTTDWTITTVACWANAGSPTVTPILTGGSGTSILSGALTCGTAAWASAAVNGTPVIKTFSGTGSTCSSTPCSADINITTAGGTAKYIVVKIVGTI